jgi:hypothetical protein
MTGNVITYRKTQTQDKKTSNNWIAQKENTFSPLLVLAQRTNNENSKAKKINDR